jgi:hypothetical protein
MLLEGMMVEVCGIVRARVFAEDERERVRHGKEGKGSRVVDWQVCVKETVWEED